MGDLRLSDVRQLFPGDLASYRDRGSVEGYSEAIVRMPQG